MKPPDASISARRVLGVVSLALVFVSPSWAMGDDPCSSPTDTVSSYLTRLSMQFNLPPEAKTIEGRAATELASRATSDGLANGRLDLLRRAFVALDLGEVKEDNESLVFNFNPEALHFDSFGQFSPRVVVHKPTLYGPLDEKMDTLDESVRQARRDELKKGLGDLDDLEITLRWTPKSQEPATDLQALVSTIYTSAAKTTLAKSVSAAKKAVVQALGGDADPFASDVSIADICANPEAKALFVQHVQGFGAEIQKANKALEQKLEEKGFFRLADLIEGEPRLVFNGTTRQRSHAAGPDETKLGVTWQLGWLSYRGAKRYAQKQGKQFDAATIDDYFSKHGRLEGSLPLFSLVTEYSEVEAFHIAIPGVVDEFRDASGHKLSGKLTAGRYFGGGRARRLELAANYDDVSDAPALQDRFVAQLSWVEQLGASVATSVGGSEFVVTLVYASKPEFRGAVDKDLGLRAGLKWSLGGAGEKK